MPETLIPPVPVRAGIITSAKLAADAITMAQLSPELRHTIASLQAWQATQLPIVTSATTANGAIEAPFSYQSHRLRLAAVLRGHRSLRAMRDMATDPNQ